MIPRRPAMIRDVVRFSIMDILPIYMPYNLYAPDDVDAPHGTQLEYRIVSINRETGAMTIEPVSAVDAPVRPSYRPENLREVRRDNLRLTDITHELHQIYTQVPFDAGTPVAIIESDGSVTFGRYHSRRGEYDIVDTAGSQENE